MRDANGSRFELLLGEDDWGRCTLVEGAQAGRTLAQVWADTRADEALVFDPAQHSLMLAPRIARFRAPPGDTPADPQRRLGATGDAFGNVYWIAEGGARIDVLNGGTRTPSVHSTAAEAAPPAPRGDFAPLAPRTPPAPPALRGLAVTGEHYLVAGVRPHAGGNGGLRAFDLLAGGPALPLRWPAAWPFDPFALAPRPCGGVAVLDRTHARVWRLGRRLGMQGVFTVEEDDASAPDDFAPDDAHAAAPAAAGAAPASHRPWFDLVVDAAGGADPVALVVLADEAVLVMDGQGSDGFALLSLYVGGALQARASTRVLLDILDVDEDEQAGFVLRGHDCALAPMPAGRPERLIIASQEGNQAYAFDLLREAGGLQLMPQRSFLPLRRFGSRGLVRRLPDDPDRLPEDTGLRYDGLGTWLPLVAEKRPRYAAHAVLESSLDPRYCLDSREPACTWHRIVFDGCVPSGSHVRIASRAGDSLELLHDAAWHDEPLPVLRPDGSELPWIQDGPGSHTDAAQGHGAWELLLQHARGRYLQLRLRLESADELASPRIFALRAWNPRFSYARRYLPAVYREDEASADFLERFLANFEGTFTALEDRIAGAPALFDVRSAPPEVLDWLAGWLGLVLDDAVGAERKRLLIRFAVPLFQYRGTTQGVRLATELVLSPCVRPEDFVLPQRSQRQPYGIRIVERFLTRRLPRVLLGETVLDAPRLVSESARWTPTDGADGLHRRFRAALAADGIAGADTAQYAPVPPAEGADTWARFSADALGAVPQLAAALSQRWSAHLATLDTAHRHGLGPGLPRNWPADTDAGAQKLWRDFLSPQSLGPELRRWLTRWQLFLARRYRRVDAYLQAWGADWPEFALVPPPDVLPAATQALADWVLFETRLEAMAQAAHRFSVLVPSSGPLAEAGALQRRMDWARKVVLLEKPAHTTFDVRPYWAMFRTGSARLGLDTLLGEGSRAPSLAPQLVAGRGHVGASRVAFAPAVPPDRLLLAC